MDMTLKDLLAMKITRKNCIILDNKTTELHKAGKTDEAAFYNLIATDMFVYLKDKNKSVKWDMEYIYNQHVDATYNESNGYNVKNPFK